FGAGIAFALQLFGKVIGYLLQIVLARWMGPAEYGLFNYVLAWVAVLAMVGGMGFPEAILRFVPEYRTTKEWGYLRGVVIRSQQFTLVVSTLLGVLFVVVALWFNKRAGTTNEWLIYSGGLLVPIFASFNLIAETFRAFHKISVAYAPRQILEPLLLIGAVLGLTLLPGVTGIRSTEVLIADLFIFLLLLSLQWSLLRRLIRSIIEPAANGSAVTQQTTNTRPQAPQFNNRLWLNTSLPMLLVAGYRIILNRSDILLLGMFMATTDLGIYSAALIIAGTVSFVLVSVNSIFAPTVAAIYKKGDLTELQKLVSTTAHWSFWPSVALGLFLVFFAEPLLGLLGREFRAGRWELLILIGG
ncbi:MAG: oligosaccharide flippase family protein, partial [Caldilineaceae bacterium]|nr:oligosaccharide flippase family protein [Caldilineaceae bacterium]